MSLSTSTSSTSSNSDSSLNKFTSNEIILSSFSPNQNNFDINNNDLFSSSSSVSYVSSLSVCKNMDLNDEEIELLQNSQYKLTITLEKLISPTDKTPRISKKSIIAKTPRPQNSWILFRRDYEANRRRKNSLKETLRTKDISIDAKKYWGNAPNEVKKLFDILSKLAREKHDSIYPNYKYKKTIKDNNLTPKGFVFKYVTQQQQQRNKIKNIKNNRISSSSSPCSPFSTSDSISTSCPNINNNDINPSNFNYNYNNSSLQSTIFLNNPNLKPDSDPNPNIQQQQSNDNINSITLDSLSYSCSLNDNNKFDDVFFDNNKFLIFQSPAVELESIDINDSNDNNNFDLTGLEFDINNLYNNLFFST